MREWLAVIFVVALAAFAANAQELSGPIRDGDRIALVGNEFFERDGDRGYIETELTTRFPEWNLTFRNLGYSGDTVRADARNLCSGWATFGPADQGLDRLKDLITHTKPTLIFVAYGMNESFAGPQGLSSFVTGLDRMLQMLSANGARIVLISPIRHEALGPPLPDPTAHNENLLLYLQAMEKVAQQRQCMFINLYEALGDGTKDEFHTPFTFDGIHLSPYGYWRTAMVLEQALGLPPRRCSIRIDALGRSMEGVGVKADALQVKDQAGKPSSLTWEAKVGMLPVAPAPKDAPTAIRQGTAHLPDQQFRVEIRGLSSEMRYSLKSHNETIAVATGEQWASGVQISSDPDDAQEERLRQTIVAKNFDFFNFWRPDNDTYIFGYRNHEQGRNAVEIPRFEPLVEAKELQIAKLRVPVRHEYVLMSESQK